MNKLFLCLLVIIILNSCKTKVSEVDYSKAPKNAKELITDSSPSNPDVLFLHFDELDGAGHGHGFSSLVEEYTNTIFY